MISQHTTGSAERCQFNVKNILNGLVTALSNIGTAIMERVRDAGAPGVVGLDSRDKDLAALPVARSYKTVVSNARTGWFAINNNLSIREQWWRHSDPFVRFVRRTFHHWDILKSKLMGPAGGAKNPCQETAIKAYISEPA